MDRPMVVYAVDESYNDHDLPHLETMRVKLWRKDGDCHLADRYGAVRWHKVVSPTSVHDTPGAAWAAYIERKQTSLQNLAAAIDVAKVRLAHALQEAEKVATP